MNKKIVLVARSLLGLMFVVFGADGLLRAITGNGIFTMPAPSPEMAAIMGGLMGLKYLFPLAKFIEFFSGILLLCNRYVNLAIVILTPVVVNILGINIFVDSSGAPMAIFIVVLLLIVIHNRWKFFKPLVVTK